MPEGIKFVMFHNFIVTLAINLSDGKFFKGRFCRKRSYFQHQRNFYCLHREKKIVFSQIYWKHFFNHIGQILTKITNFPTNSPGISICSCREA